MDIPVFFRDVNAPIASGFDLAQPGNVMHIRSAPHPNGAGNTWRYSFEEEVNEWWGVPGVYQWAIFDSTSHRLIGYYVGEASTFSGRVADYWTCMSPQLVGFFDGVRAVGVRHGEYVRQKSGLRWVHLWLAQAYVHGHQVQLSVTTMPGSNRAWRRQQEHACIEAAIEQGVPVLNQEHAGLGITRLDLCARHLLDLPQAPLNGPGSLTIPVDWTYPFNDGSAQQWMAAISEWAHEWYDYRELIGRPVLPIL